MFESRRCNQFRQSSQASGGEIPMNVIVEIRAAEGGEHAKALVTKHLTVYVRLAARRGL